MASLRVGYLFYIAYLNKMQEMLLKAGIIRLQEVVAVYGSGMIYFGLAVVRDHRCTREVKLEKP